MKQTHKKDLTNATNAIIVVTESQSNATEGRGERVNKMKITIEIGGAKREVYCFQREEDFLTVLSVKKCTGYSPLTYRCTLATVLHLWWQGMLEKIGISDR